MGRERGDGAKVRPLLAPVLAMSMAGCYFSLAEHDGPDGAPDLLADPFDIGDVLDSTDLFDTSIPSDVTDAIGDDPLEPEVCIVNLTPGSAAGEIGRFAGIPGPVDLAGVFTEGDQILMVLRGAGVCLVRLDADLRILSTTGWDTRFNEDPFAYWRTVELTSGTGLFDLRDPIRYAVAPPGGHPGAIASRGVGFPDVIDSKAVGAAPEGGFLVAWNDSWDIHTAGFASDGGLLGGFHHLTDDGRYPSLMFWRDHSIIGYHGGGVVGPFVNFIKPTGEPSTRSRHRGSSTQLSSQAAGTSSGRSGWKKPSTT